MHPSSLIDQNFGMVINSDDLLTFVVPPIISGVQSRPWEMEAGTVSNVGSNYTRDNCSFLVHLDVQHFKPENIYVSATHEDVIIEGCHDLERDEHGLVKRMFYRHIPLPENVLPNEILSKLSSDGVLTVYAPKKERINNDNHIPIVRTGPVCYYPKDNE